MSPLETNSMIVKLAVSNWTARKNDPLLAEDLTRQYDAESDAARVSKQLIAKESLKDIRKAISSAKTWHDALTLPWGDHGERLLPVDIHAKYVERIDRAIEKLNRARRQFLHEYEELVTEARSTLGRMFNEEDYPSATEVSYKFAIRYEISPVPTADHFIVDLTDKHADRIKADIEKRTQTKLDHAVVQLYERVEKALRRLIERLGVDEEGKPRRIHKTALETIQQLADVIPAMNLTQDARLGEIGRRIRKVLKDVEIGDLRHRSKKAEAVQMVNLRREKLTEELSAIAGAYFGTPAGDDDEN